MAKDRRGNELTQGQTVLVRGKVQDFIGAETAIVKVERTSAGAATSFDIATDQLVVEQASPSIFDAPAAAGSTE